MYFAWDDGPAASAWGSKPFSRWGADMRTSPLWIVSSAHPNMSPYEPSLKLQTHGLSIAPLPGANPKTSFEYPKDGGLGQIRVPPALHSLKHPAQTVFNPFTGDLSLTMGSSCAEFRCLDKSRCWLTQSFLHVIDCGVDHEEPSMTELSPRSPRHLIDYVMLRLCWR